MKNVEKTCMYPMGCISGEHQYKTSCDECYFYVDQSDGKMVKEVSNHLEWLRKTR